MLPLVCSLLLVAVASCQRNEVYMEYRAVNSAAWTNNEKLEFDLGPVPEDGVYVLSVELRTTESNTYPYKDLLIEVRQLWSREDDAEKDSLYRANDSLRTISRAEMDETMHLLSLYDERLGRDRDEEVDDDESDTLSDDDDDEADEDNDSKSRKNKKKNAKSKKKGGKDKEKDAKKRKDEPRRPSPRDSILAITDSLNEVIEHHKGAIRQYTSINDSIDSERARRVYADTVCFSFDSDELRPTGIVVRQYTLPVKVIRLHEGQTAHITLRHIMRLEAIPGISDVGLTLEMK